MVCEKERVLQNREFCDSLFFVLDSWSDDRVNGELEYSLISHISIKIQTHFSINMKNDPDSKGRKWE